MNDYLAIAFSRLVPVLKSLGIRYTIVGSLASGTRGEHRATAGGDVLAQIRPQQSRALVEALGKEWYAEPEAIESAIRQRRSFNVIHIPTASKVDIFPATSDFHLVQMERSTAVPVFPSDDSLQLPVISPEDVVLAKLEWYAAGGEVSEKQWNDIQGVLTMQQSLDMEYLNTWAQRLGVTRLLARALDEAIQT